MKKHFAQVDIYTTALGKTNRYQPTEEVPAEEVQDVVNLLSNQMQVMYMRLQTFPSINSRKLNDGLIKINLPLLLHSLTEVQRTILRLHLILGLAHCQEAALDEIHESEMTRLWADGKIHKDGDGHILVPDTYHVPDMRWILKQVNLLPEHLFSKTPEPKSVTHLDEPQTTD